MLIKTIDKTAAKESEVTPYSIYMNRRNFMEGIATSAALISAGTVFGTLARPSSALAAGKLPNFKKGGTFNTDEKLTPFKDVSTYNNYYEFGTDKSEPAQYAKGFKTDGWKVSVEGLVEKPKVFDLSDLIKTFPLEERIYRLRCVEGWSMVIPWIGFPLADLIKAMKPTSAAKYVEFITLKDAARMPGQKGGVLDWPYVEGLRMDEALHPLALLAVGLYGETLPNQNGAPIRLVVPWKYGFKSIKSIVTIRFTDKEPQTTWNRMAPKEYGFYANVNPKVDHPRWTQAKERRIGEFFKRETKMFNGYDAVASLYKDLDLKKNY